MANNVKHWANNCAGIFLALVLMFVVTIAINRFAPHPATGTVLWLLALLGMASLGGWAWLSFKAAEHTLNRVLLSRR